MIFDRIHTDDRNSFTEKLIEEEEDIMFGMNLLSVNDLGRDGVLRISVRMNTTIVDDQLRWDENRRNCNISTKVCFKIHP